MDIQSNGSTHPDGGIEGHGAQVIPMMIVGDGGIADGTPFTEAVEATASQVEERMQDLRSKAAALDHNVQQQQSAMAQYEASLNGVEQQVQGVNQQMQGIERQVQVSDQRVQGVEQVLTELGEQLTALVRSMDELRGKVSDVTTSIGEMNQEIATLRETAIPPIKEDVEILKAQPRTGSSMRLKIVVFLIIVVGGYSIIGKPGWTTVTAMLPQSITGLF